MSLCVSGDKVAGWIQDANAKEKTGREMEMKAHTGAAMAHYLVAGRLLTVALDVILSCKGQQEQLTAQTKAAVCKQENTQDHCNKDNQAFESWLSGRIRQLQAKAEEMSKKYCSERQQLLGASGDDGGGDGGGEESWSTCHAGLRGTIEHTMNAGDDACSKAWFDLILGQQRAKDGLREGFMMPLLYPNLFAKQSRAVLLYGSPGTGKTLLAKAVANELSQGSRVRMLMFAPQHSDIKSKYVGESEQKITQIFKCASKWARDAEKSLAECSYANAEGKVTKREPTRVMAIVFLDEVEVLAGDRASDKSGFGGATLNTLLQEMDGIKSHDNVVVVAATNYPWQLDAAFLRRFSKRIFVELPDGEDIYRYVNMEISNAILGFDPKKGQPSTKTVAKPNTAPSCNVCTHGEKTAAIERSDPDGFRKNDAVGKFVRNLEPGQLRALCARFAENRYSLSDMSNVMAAVMQMAGQEGLSNGTFVREKIRIATAEEDIYVSTLCYADADLKDREIYRIPEPGVEPGKVRVLTIGNETFQHYGNHTFSIPAGTDSRILENSIFVRDVENEPMKKDIVVKLALRASAAGRKQRPNPFTGQVSASDEKPGDGTKTEQGKLAKWLAAQFSNHGTAVSWEDIQKCANGLRVNPSAFASAWGMYEAGDTSRIEKIYMRMTIDVKPGMWTQVKDWILRPKKPRDPQATVLKEMEVRGVLNTLLTLTKSVRLYSAWGCPLESESKLVLTFSPSEKNREVAYGITTQGETTSIITNAEKFLQMLADGVDFPDKDNLFDPSRSLLTEMCTEESNGCTLQKIDTTTTIVEKTQDVGQSATIQPLLPGQEPYLVNWNYTVSHFASVCKDVPSSADPRMIRLLEEYAKNPAKILDCMTASTRPELPTECKKLVGTIPAAKPVCGND